MSSNIKHPIECQVLFIDLDGTLVDSVPDMATAVNRMLVDLKFPEVAEFQVRTWVGNGLPRLVQRALWGQFDAPEEHPDLESAVSLCRAHYTDCIHDQTQCYDGVQDSLLTLAEQGFKLVCITNKPESLSRTLLSFLPIGNYFSLILGGDSLATRKPDPGPLFYAARHFNLDISDCLMIGDSSSDINAAKSAGCASICVSYVYNQGIDPVSLGPTVIVDHFPEILDYVVFKA